MELLSILERAGRLAKSGRKTVVVAKPGTGKTRLGIPSFASPPAVVSVPYYTVMSELSQRLRSLGMPVFEVRGSHLLCPLGDYFPGRCMICPVSPASSFDDARGCRFKLQKQLLPQALKRSVVLKTHAYPLNPDVLKIIDEAHLYEYGRISIITRQDREFKYAKMSNAELADLLERLLRDAARGKPVDPATASALTSLAGTVRHHAGDEVVVVERYPRFDYHIGFTATPPGFIKADEVIELSDKLKARGVVVENVRTEAHFFVPQDFNRFLEFLLKRHPRLGLFATGRVAREARGVETYLMWGKSATGQNLLHLDAAAVASPWLPVSVYRVLPHAEEVTAAQVIQASMRVRPLQRPVVVYFVFNVEKSRRVKEALEYYFDLQYVIWDGERLRPA